MKNFKLTRPVVFFDLETTGLWPEKDRIIEIAMIKVFPDGHEETYETRIDPEMKIPAESLAIHGIEDKELVGKPKFKEVAHKIIAMMEGCDLGGFAIERLDVHILAKEFKHTGLDYDFGLCSFLDCPSGTRTGWRRGACSRGTSTRHCRCACRTACHRDGRPP